MKIKAMDTITSHKQHGRMRIFDGSLDISKAGQELLRVEKAQHAATRFLNEKPEKELLVQIKTLKAGNPALRKAKADGLRDAAKLVANTP